MEGGRAKGRGGEDRLMTEEEENTDEEVDAIISRWCHFLRPEGRASDTRDVSRASDFAIDKNMAEPRLLPLFYLPFPSIPSPSFSLSISPPFLSPFPHYLISLTPSHWRLLPFSSPSLPFSLWFSPPSTSLHNLPSFFRSLIRILWPTVSHPILQRREFEPNSKILPKTF